MPNYQKAIQFFCSFWGF